MDKKGMQKLSFAIVLTSFISILILANGTNVFAFSKGNTLLNVSYSLVTTDETGTGIVYTPNIFTKGNFPFKFFYNGTLAPATLTIDISSAQNLSWIISNLTGNVNANIADVWLFGPVNTSVSIPIYSQINQSFPKLSNDTTIPSGCTLVNATLYRCPKTIQNSTFQTSVIANNWFSIVGNPITINKSQVYYINLVVYQVPSTGDKQFDVIPSIAGFQAPELAFFFANMTYCRNLTVDYRLTNHTNKHVDVQINTSGWGNQPYNNSIRIASAGCNVNSTTVYEINSTVYDIKTNGTGIMSLFNATWWENGTITSNLTRGMYFDIVDKGNTTYNSGLLVSNQSQEYNVTIDGTRVFSLLGGGVNFFNTSNRSSTLNYNTIGPWQNSISVSWFGVNKDNTPPNAATCSIIYNSSEFVELQCLNRTDSTVSMNVKIYAHQKEIYYVNIAVLERGFTFIQTLEGANPAYIKFRNDTTGSATGYNISNQQGGETYTTFRGVAIGFQGGDTNGIGYIWNDSLAGTNNSFVYTRDANAQDPMWTMLCNAHTGPCTTAPNAANISAMQNLTLGIWDNTTGTLESNYNAINKPFIITVGTQETGNSAPLVTKPAINPIPAYISSTLNASTLMTDADNNNATVNFTWFKNGLNVQNSSIGVVTNGTNISALATFTFTHFDNISVNVVANDTVVGPTQNGTNLTISDSAPVINSQSFNRTYVNASDTFIRLAINVTDPDNTSDIANVTVDIIRPAGTINVTNATMSRSTTDIWEYNFSIQSDFAEGNWTVHPFANDTPSGLSINSTFYSFIIDKTLPNVTIIRTASMDGRLRGKDSSNITLRFLDSYFNNWTVNISNTTSGTYLYNGTGNSTFNFNATSTDPVGNWTVTLTGTDLAGNANTSTSWLGIASVTVNNESAYEGANFTTPASAWGNATALSNNSVTDFDYYKIIRFTYSGLCSNCLQDFIVNTTNNFTGSYSIVQMLNNTNNTINFTLTSVDIVNATDTVNLLTEQNITQDIRIQTRVPNSLTTILKPDGAVLWLGAIPRNISANLHINNSYIRLAVTNAHSFDGSFSHPRYNFCLAVADASQNPPTCSTLSTPVDVTDANNGNNGNINMFFDGPVNAINIRRTTLSLSHFLYRETIEGGGTSQAGGGGGGGGGGGLGTPTVTKVTTVCPSGYYLANDTNLGTQTCQLLALPSSNIDQSNVARFSFLIIALGIIFIFYQQRNSRRKKKSSILNV